jgi:lysophospholipase L1-like esterase
MKKPLIVLGLLTALAVHAQNATPALAVTGAAPVASAATASSALPALKSSDIPRSTQAGPPPSSGRGIPAPFPADPTLPTFWLIGDSTVRNGTAGDGGNGQWGWGAPLVAYFDAKKVNVGNRAAGGTSARSFYNANWKNLVGLIKKGDVVIMQFGTNDGGNPSSTVGDLKGVGDETQNVTGRSGNAETVHAFGWYLKQMIKETEAKGATAVVCSLIPRKAWATDGHLQRSAATFGGWAQQVAKSENVGFIDLNELIARRYDGLGKAKVDLLYYPGPSATNPLGEHVHTGWDGAVINAEIVVSGLKALKDDPVTGYFSERGQAIAAADLNKPAPAPAATSAPATPTAVAPAAATATK